MPTILMRIYLRKDLKWRLIPFSLFCIAEHWPVLYITGQFCEAFGGLSLQGYVILRKGPVNLKSVPLDVIDVHVARGKEIIGHPWFIATIWVFIVICHFSKLIYPWWLFFIPACISNHISSKVCDEITYPLRNFNGAYMGSNYPHDDVIKWKHFPRNRPFVREIHRSPVNFPHKGQWRGALMFSLIYAWINDWVNNREAGDLKRQHGHYDVIVMNYAQTATAV